MRFHGWLLLFLFVRFAFGQGAVSSTELARQVLSAGAASGDPVARREVALALGLIGREEPAVASLRRLMTDGDVEVRVAAIGSAADVHDPSMIPHLRETLEDPVPEVQFAAAKALWNYRQPDGREWLLAVLEGDKRAKSNLLRRKYRLVMRSFSTPKRALLFALTEGVGFVPVPGAGAGFSALESLVSESEFSPRASVAILLAKDRGPGTQRALADALKDDDWSVRAAAAQALAMRNQPSMSRDLAPLLSDKKPQVRYRAAAAYLRLRDIARHQSPARKP